MIIIDSTSFPGRRSSLLHASMIAQTLEDVIDPQTPTESDDEGIVVSSPFFSRVLPVPRPGQVYFVLSTQLCTLLIESGDE